MLAALTLTATLAAADPSAACAMLPELSKSLHELNLTPAEQGQELRTGNLMVLYKSKDGHWVLVVIVPVKDDSGKKTLAGCIAAAGRGWAPIK